MAADLLRAYRLAFYERLRVFGQGLAVLRTLSQTEPVHMLCIEKSNTVVVFSIIRIIPSFAVIRPTKGSRNPFENIPIAACYINTGVQLVSGSET